MSKANKRSYRHVFVYAGLAVAALAGALIVGFSPATRWQAVTATQQAGRNADALQRSAVMPVSGQRIVAPAPRVTDHAVTTAQLKANYGKLPLSFELNQGQTDPRVKFLAHGRGYGLFLTSDEAVLQMQVSGIRGQVPGVKPTHSAPEKGLQRAMDHGPRTNDAVLRMKLVGANARAAVTGAAELPGKVNYFIGNDPKKWRTNVPTYAQVKYQDVYPGVDLVYYGNQGGQLEYDFVVAPGADPSAIALGIDATGQVGSGQLAVGSGLSKIQNLKSKIDADGDLVITTASGDIRFHKPIVYQEADAEFRIPQPGARNPKSLVRFQI